MGISILQAPSIILLLGKIFAGTTNESPYLDLVALLHLIHEAVGLVSL